MKGATGLMFAFLAVGAADGEVVSNKHLGFSATFPCEAKQSLQQVATRIGKIPMTSFNCGNGSDIYYVVVSDYPRGFIANRTLGAAYADAVNGAADNVKGIVENVKPYPLAAVTGRDALIDVPADKAMVRLRVFFLGDRQYQVMALGPAGVKTDNTKLQFLDSFKLTGK
jgi:hypothetical protein